VFAKRERTLRDKAVVGRAGRKAEGTREHFDEKWRTEGRVPMWACA